MDAASLSASPGAGAFPLWAAAALGAALLVAFALWWRQRAIGRRLQASVESLTTRLDEAEDHSLPGVLPRPRFDALLDEAVAACDRGERRLTLVFVNLDNLQSVNEAFGHGCGDVALQRAAEAMTTCVDDTAVVTRTGGDAFVMMVDADLAKARTLADALIARLGGAHGESSDPDLVCSIGLASYPQHGSRARIIGHASTAMRQVRLAGGGDYAVFDPAMSVDMKDQAELLRDLRQAVSLKQLELVYQPKIDARSLQITSAEALLRWHHPQRGLISPAIFIPLAERFGLIGPIGNWVIEDACRQAGLWRQSGLRMRVAINISAYQMRQDDLVDRLTAALAANGLSANRFTCEITESVAMEDTRVTHRTFDRMRKAGLHVSIDDFGVGQASLSYLRRLPAAELKIDASFVQDLATSADARAIVDAVVKVAHALHLRVVAEGVETERQRDLLVQLDCDELQGYLFARPMSAKALSLWAAEDDRPDQPTGFRPSLFRDTLPVDL
ncbi:bifunctional diguanylate cyclase/phosphodiesterase [Ideonella sp. A 288]|uniref:putative bifunctional diguanylate cyclase/phosphodiesterase n=1 Tax=Ideonella sp. A 288 TaxID=1962181 RepID=UPI000B4BBDBD|nr:phosphodiesterase [Ideonella sp. A 288]